MHETSINRERERERANIFYRKPDSCIVFGHNNRCDPENDIALHRIPLVHDHPPESEKKEKMDQFCNLSLAMKVLTITEETLFNQYPSLVHTLR